MRVRVSIVDGEVREPELAVDSEEGLSVVISVHARDREALPSIDATAIARIVELFVASRGELYIDRIPVRTGNRTIFVRTDEVDWIKAEGNYVVVSAKGVAHMIRGRIGALAEKLDPRRFLRVHRSAIVSVDRVTEIRSKSNGGHIVVLADETRFDVSRGCRDALFRLLGEPA